MSGAPSRFDPTGRRPPLTSDRWRARRLTATNPLWGSNGVAFGPDGRLYVAQFLAGQISAVDLASGDVEVVVAPDGPIQAPDDLVFGADGAMYVTDLVPGRVWRRGPDGGFAVVAEGLRAPNGIACVGDRLFVNEMAVGGKLVELFPAGGEPRVLTDGLAMGNAMQLGPDGGLYYPHMLTGQVFRIAPDGGTPELVAGEVHEPVAVRFDHGGVLLVLSRGAAGIVTRVGLFGGAGREVVTSGIAGLDNAAFDAENRMFVSSFASGGVAELHPDGRSRQVVRPGLDGPYGVTVDLAGNVLAADHYRLAGPTAGSPGVTTHLLRPFAHGVAADRGIVHLSSQYGEVRSYDPATGDNRVRVTGLDRPLGLAVLADGRLVVAESGAGRVVTIDADDTVAVLAEGLGRPVDVALDAAQRCYVSDEERGAVYRIVDGGVTAVAAGLAAPQGLAVREDEIFVIETAARRLRAISLSTGASRIEAEELAVGPPTDRADPPLFAHGMPGVPRQFAGLAVAPDGSLHLAADGEGSLVHLVPADGVVRGFPPRVGSAE